MAYTIVLQKQTRDNGGESGVGDQSQEAARKWSASSLVEVEGKIGDGEQMTLGQARAKTRHVDATWSSGAQKAGEGNEWAGGPLPFDGSRFPSLGGSTLKHRREPDAGCGEAVLRAQRTWALYSPPRYCVNLIPKAQNRHQNLSSEHFETSRRGKHLRGGTQYLPTNNNEDAHKRPTRRGKPLLAWSPRNPNPESMRGHQPTGSA